LGLCRTLADTATSTNSLVAAEYLQQCFTASPQAIVNFVGRTDSTVTAGGLNRGHQDIVQQLLSRSDLIAAWMEVLALCGVPRDLWQYFPSSQVPTVPLGFILLQLLHFVAERHAARYGPAQQAPDLPSVMRGAAFQLAGPAGDRLGLGAAGFGSPFEGRALQLQPPQQQHTQFGGRWVASSGDAGAYTDAAALPAQLFVRPTEAAPPPPSVAMPLPWLPRLDPVIVTDFLPQMSPLHNPASATPNPLPVSTPRLLQGDRAWLASPVAATGLPQTPQHELAAAAHFQSSPITIGQYNGLLTPLFTTEDGFAAAGSPVQSHLSIQLERRNEVREKFDHKLLCLCLMKLTCRPRYPQYLCLR
jgi:hypothetical protein